MENKDKELVVADLLMYKIEMEATIRNAVVDAIEQFADNTGRHPVSINVDLVFSHELQDDRPRVVDLGVSSTIDLQY